MAGFSQPGSAKSHPHATLDHTALLPSDGRLGQSPTPFFHSQHPNAEAPAQPCPTLWTGLTERSSSCDDEQWREGKGKGLSHRLIFEVKWERV